MYPQKFRQNYRCDCYQPDNYCNCASKEISSEVLIENVTDTAKSLIEVMKVCGNQNANTKPTTDVIIYYFLNFEEIPHRIDGVPKKRLNREDLMLNLVQKCDMNQKESQMAFSIIKRAFRAFYHGTGPGGVPIRFKNELKHSSECLWAHAAQRTAQVCACYEDMFYATQKNLECKIKLIYKQLLDSIMEKIPHNDDHDCYCTKCSRRTAKETLKSTPSTYDFHIESNPYEALFLKEQETVMEEEASKKICEKTKLSCFCPSLSVSENDYRFRENAEKIQINTSRGPFECRWFSICKDEFEADETALNIKLPEEFSCYSWQSDEESSAECECPSEECPCETVTESEMEREGEVDVDGD